MIVCMCYSVVISYLQTLSQLPVVEERGETPELPEDNEEESHDTEPKSNDQDEKSDDQEAESHDQSHDEGVSSVAIAPHRHKPGAMCPYGLPCVKELLRFLTSIINVAERFVCVRV